MSPRPAIFISAVSCELRSARQLVANTLTFLGYEPEWQDIFGTEEGDLRAILCRRIDASKGLVQLLGKCYGAEPPSIDEQFGRVSYTQFEALYAKAKGKKIWYLFLDDNFPIDPHELEHEEKQKLQSDYRARVKAESHLYHPLSSKEGLEATVLKLRDELTCLRRGVKRWAAFVAGLLVLIMALSVWLLQSQQDSNKQLQAVQEKLDKLQRGVNSFAEVQNKIRQERPGQKPDEIDQRTYVELGKELGLDPAMLKKQLPVFAQGLKKAPNASTYERANAAYVAKDYNEAERLALASADEAQGASPPKNSEAIKALELAGWAAEQRIEYADALERLRDAEKLTDRARDGVEWAGVQFAIARVYYYQGQYQDAEGVLRKVLEIRDKALGPNHPDTLTTRRVLAIALVGEGKYAEAEIEYRALTTLTEQVLGREHPDTLMTRNNLALALADQGKYEEAEAEDREVISLEEKVLGSEHPVTLTTRSNLAFALDDEGKFAAAEEEDRIVLQLREKVLGPEHPDTLQTRHNLALVFYDRGEYAQAETEYRAVLKLEEKALGPQHPMTLMTRHNLAIALDNQGKYADAEAEYRAVLRLEEKVLGPQHPNALATRNGLAEALGHQGKYADAEFACRDALELEEKVLGPEHPNVLITRSGLAEVLDDQGRYADAETEYRAVLRLEEKVLSAQSPDTLTARNGLAEVHVHQGNYAEAETECRAVLQLREKVLGSTHPDTLKTCFDLATCLRAENKLQEASTFAQRAADGARKVLGPDHPDTKKYEQLSQELLPKEG
jgi:tetratricopeptide (TPR) repeat protein